MRVFAETKLQTVCYNIAQSFARSLVAARSANGTDKWLRSVHLDKNDTVVVSSDRWCQATRPGVQLIACCQQLLFGAVDVPRKRH